MSGQLHWHKTQDTLVAELTSAKHLPCAASVLGPTVMAVPSSQMGKLRATREQ